LSSAQLRVALAGATGSLGREVVAQLGERRFPIGELIPFATDRSVGEEVEFEGDPVPVAGEAPALRGLDLLVSCAPALASLELVRDALRAQVPVIDCSGALAASPEVPLGVAGATPASELFGAAAIANPSGTTLGLLPVLAAFDQAAGLIRARVTLLQSAALAGRAGMDALSGETIALLNQSELPETETFGRSIAFDCLPRAGRAGEPAPAGTAPGTSAVESALSRDLLRLLGGSPVPGFSVTAVQVPTFVGDGASLALELDRPLPAAQAAEVLAKDPRVELWEGDREGPSTRDTAAFDEPLVGRIRADASLADPSRGVLCWVALDPLRLAARNAVQLAEARLRLH